jgi:type II secretory pathway component PulM
LMKKSAKVLLYFRLDSGMLEFFTYVLQSKEQLIYLAHFLGTVQGKRSRFEHMQTVIRTSRRLDSFLHEVAQNFEHLSNIQGQNKK